MKTFNIFIVVILMVFSGNALSAELKDPMSRNEDLSHSIVTVDVSIGTDGNYIYEYVVENPTTNLGRISTMWIDISCDLDIPDTLGLGTMDDYSKEIGDGKHVPVYAESDTGLNPFVTSTNKLNFTILRSPGEIKKGIRIISPQPPVERKYFLHPAMDNQGWDYSAYAEDLEPDKNSSLPYPWKDDFKIEGTISAPACTLDNTVPPGDDNGSGDDTDESDNTDCKKGKGNAYGLEKGLGHEISNGKHLGHEHNCE